MSGAARNRGRRAAQGARDGVERIGAPLDAPRAPSPFFVRVGA